MEAVLLGRLVLQVASDQVALEPSGSSLLKEELCVNANRHRGNFWELITTLTDATVPKTLVLRVGLLVLKKTKVNKRSSWGGYIAHRAAVAMSVITSHFQSFF